MDTSFQAPVGYLTDTGTAKGLGVFAPRDIADGETVEVAPLLRFLADFEELDPALRDRVFTLDGLPGLDGYMAIALGYGSLYNHGDPANVRYESRLDGSAMVFVAARAISAGEELTINYERDPDDGHAVVSWSSRWFEPRGIDPI